MSGSTVRESPFLDSVLKNKDLGDSSTILNEKVTLYMRDGDFISAIQDGEEEIASLPDLTFEVTKINQRGKKQIRKLMLTSEGIANIRPDKNPSKEITSSLHTYRSVLRVDLKDDINTILIKYDNDHEYVYSTPRAMELVQEISRRCSLRQRQDKRLLTFDIALSYQESIYEAEDETLDPTLPSSEDDINLANQQTSSSSSSSLSSHKRRGSINNSNSLKPPSNVSASSVSSMSTNGSTSSGKKSPRTRFLIANLAKTSNADSPRGSTSSEVALKKSRLRQQLKKKYTLSQVLQVHQESEVQILTKAIDKVVFDATTAEGRTIAGYIKHFKFVEKKKNLTRTLSSIRQFLDGMRWHLLDRRAAGLVKLRPSPPAISMRGPRSKTPKGKSGSFRRSSSKPPTSNLGAGNATMAASSSAGGPSKPPALVAQDSDQPPELDYSRNLSIAIEHSLERCIIGPLFQRIFPALIKFYRDDDIIITKHKTLLSKGSQADFGIESKLQSPHNWASAIAELSYIDRHETPHEKLTALLDSVKNIYLAARVNYSTWIEAQQKAGSGTGSMRKKFLSRFTGSKSSTKAFAISADEFLPIFIYVFVHSKIEQPLATVQFLWSLADPNLLSSEQGYYMTILESAAEFCKGIDPNSPFSTISQKN